MPGQCGCFVNLDPLFSSRVEVSLMRSTAGSKVLMDKYQLDNEPDERYLRPIWYIAECITEIEKVRELFMSYSLLVCCHPGKLSLKEGRPWFSVTLS